MRGSRKQNDPLQQLFEHHLLNRSYDDAAAFSKEVAKEYLGYIDTTLAHIPIHLRSSLLEDLEAEAHEMLVKKMYGVSHEVREGNFGKVTVVGPKNKSVKPVEFYPPPALDPAPDSSEER